MLKLYCNVYLGVGMSMRSNFDFIIDDGLYDIKNACIEAEKGLIVTATTCAIMSRKALELAVKWVYGIDGELTIPYQQTLATLIYDRNFKNIIDPGLYKKLFIFKNLEIKLFIVILKSASKNHCYR